MALIRRPNMSDDDRPSIPPLEAPSDGDDQGARNAREPEPAAAPAAPHSLAPPPTTLAPPPPPPNWGAVAPQEPPASDSQPEDAGEAESESDAEARPEPAPVPISTRSRGPRQTARSPGDADGHAPTTTELRSKLHRTLIAEIDQTALSRMPQDQARASVAAAARELIGREVPAGLGSFRDRLLEQLVDDILGLGPIEPLLRDPSVSEVMVNGANQVYVERAGRLSLSGVQFRDNAHVIHVIERILAPTGRVIDEANPMVDARLPDGSRVNAVIPPASIIGPLLTIRKFVADRLQASDLVASGSLTEDASALLEAAVNTGLNIIVSGGTGSGKTTLLNVLSTWIPEDQRIVTIEDPAELSMRQPHVVSLEARPTSGSQQKLGQAELLKNSLRMRPDRIIIGEVRGAEAFDMLQAMNTGHEGSMSTTHANSPRDAVRRIENMVMMAGFDLPIRAIREQIASAIDLVVQVARLRDGSRRVTALSEVVGMEDQTVTMQDLYLFEQSGIDDDGRILGTLVSTGLRPRFADRLQDAGHTLTAYLPPDESAEEGAAGKQTPGWAA